MIRNKTKTSTHSSTSYWRFWPEQRDRKRKKATHIKKEEVKSPLFVNDMIFYVENPKEPTLKKKKHANYYKLLELIHKFSKVAGYKINIPKSVVFLY